MLSEIDMNMETTSQSNPTVHTIEPEESVHAIRPEEVAVRSLIRRHSRLFMSTLMIAADLSSLILIMLLAVTIRYFIGRPFAGVSTYLQMMPVVVVFLLAYALSGLYPAIGLTPVEEMRRTTITTSAVMMVLVAATFYTKTSIEYSRLIFGMFWVFALMGVPLSRWLVRRIALRLNLWGEPVALIGFGVQGLKILEFLKKNRQYGFDPVVVINGAEQRIDINRERTTILSSETLLKKKDLLSQMGVRTAILVPLEVAEPLRNAIVDEQQFGLQRLILISSLNWIGGSAIIAHDLQGILGLEVERNLLNWGEKTVKRFIDLASIGLTGIVLVPVIGLISLWIRLDSKGPVFYNQKRVGRNGKLIRIWKFRSMVDNAEQKLQESLDCNPEWQAEWEANHKIKNDPRITRAGKFLRRTSMDELPQLWNVIRGEMSLVGPRPIVEDEIERYDPSLRLYQQVLPGMTGLWQVSGRSDTSYAYRVSLDEYYIRHWSVWLDIYILIRTLWVVIKGIGAY